eukprot:SAG31_NODE_31279_length_370_cov_0.571956_1_plen_66_part_10
MLDLLSVRTGRVFHSNRSALQRGRWGTSCIATADGEQLVFAGGKLYPRMTDEVYSLQRINGPAVPS